MKLYRIQTIAPEFQGRQNVSFDWFVSNRANFITRDACKLVEDYPLTKDNPRRGFLDAAIDELFDGPEAKALADWLRTNRPELGAPEIIEIELPLPRDSISIGCLPVGGDDDFLSPIHDGKPVRIQPLGFEVMGYFHIESALAEPVSATLSS